MSRQQLQQQQRQRLTRDHLAAALRLVLRQLEEPGADARLHPLADALAEAVRLEAELPR